VGEHHPAISSTDAHALAERVAAAMYARDTASKALGMKIAQVSPGSCGAHHAGAGRHAERPRRSVMADSTSRSPTARSRSRATAYNFNTVASGCGIDFVAPAREGDVLTARAHERALSGRRASTTSRVANQRGETVALFRGKSYRIKGHLIETGVRDEFSVMHAARS
jgi:acyl-CoA thioesterase